MRIGGFRVSRLAMMGDPLSGALGLLQVGGGIASRISGFGRGKQKRRQGAISGKLPKMLSPGTAMIPMQTAPGTVLPAAPLPQGVRLPPLPGGGRVPIPMEFPPGGGVQLPNLGPLDTWLRRLLAGGGAATGYRRRRRMNVLNPRALRRSITRVQGFARFARKTVQLTQRVKLKKRRRR